MFTKAQIKHDEAMRKGATEARRLTITSHSHHEDGSRHPGPLSECSEIDRTNREWAFAHDTECMSCGHIATEYMTWCECCRLALEATGGPDATCRYCGTSAEYADAIAHRDCPSDAFSARCESGWTGDRCTFPLGHEGPHSND